MDKLRYIAGILILLNIVGYFVFYTAPLKKATSSLVISSDSVNILDTATLDKPSKLDTPTLDKSSKIDIVIKQLDRLNYQTRKEYIIKYYNYALLEQATFSIPASITITQAFLESNNGTSFLAEQGNNHFGIKWHGIDHIPEGLRKYVKGYVLAYDDCYRNGKEVKCKFVSYNSIWASYRHHSYILLKNRYQKYLKPNSKFNDWAWAFKYDKGCYATSKTYHKDIINLIHKYKLYELDE